MLLQTDLSDWRCFQISVDTGDMNLPLYTLASQTHPLINYPLPFAPAINEAEITGEVYIALSTDI